MLCMPKLTMNSALMQYDPTRPIHCPSWFERLPLARWGWKDLNMFGWPLVAAVVICLLLGDPWCWLAIVPALLFVWLVSFFRDPKRSIPDGPNLIVAPADGLVTDVTTLDHYDFLDGPAIRVGIFLSIFNVHINRAPFTGRVLETHYQPGKFLNAQRPESSDENEFMWLGFDTTERPTRRFAVRQISGMLARKIVCTLQPGSTIARGEKFGMIKLGSRTELIVPEGAAQIHIRVGDKVRAGADVLGRWL
jgi:phosphatidylserine decarboxylase